MRSRLARHLQSLVDDDAASAAATLFAKPFAIAKAMAPAADVDSDTSLDIPPELSAHDYAVFLLQVAAEIEHGLMVQYLYAAYSLGGPQVPHDRREAVKQWQDVILGIAKEEMGHLVTVQNLLTVLGGPQNFDREDYPYESGFYPFALTLERLTKDSLAKYIFAEMPQDWNEPGSEEIKARAIKASGGKAINRVGKLYGTLLELVESMDPEYLGDREFLSESVPYQASWDEWGRGYRGGARGQPAGEPHRGTPNLLISAVSSRSQAASAIKDVMEQGESPSEAADAEKSHFRRFLAIYNDFPEDDATWTATRPVPTNPKIAIDIDHPRAVGWAHLLNVRYRMLLDALAHAFYLSRRESDVQAGVRGVIISKAFGEMYFIKAVSEILVGLPLKRDGDAAKVAAGPPFELPYTMKLPVGEANRWRRHQDLIVASARLIESLGKVETGSAAAFLRSMHESDQQMLDVVARLIVAK